RQTYIRLRNRREIFIDPGIQLLLIEVADDDNRRVVRAIIGVMKLDDVIDGRRLKIFDAPDAFPLIWMKVPGISCNRYEESPIRWREHALAILIIDRKRRQTFSLRPQQCLKIIRRNGLVIDGGVVLRRRVVVASNVFGKTI